MKKKLREEIEIPEGIICEVDFNKLTCKKDSLETSKLIEIPKVETKVEDKKLVLSTDKGSKKEYKIIKTFAAHIRNIFSGLNEPHIYKLESCNVHFPMTIKKEGEFLIINNFLGEKIPRKAAIVSGAEVEIKGNIITVSSYDKDVAGQTAANIEKATKVKGRDRRIFQDGIFITDKPRRALQ